MSDQFLHVTSVSQLTELLNYEKPTHPLITIIDVSQIEIQEAWTKFKFTSDLYVIALKDFSCGLEYGRNSYDFEEGVLMFTAPNQVYALQKAQKKGDMNGWMMYFHPDLIRNTPLGSRIDSYSFFSYDVHEALHLSEKEEQNINDCIEKIQQEIGERIDNHSQMVISSTLELLLNYSSRYYERQFNTRKANNIDILTQVEKLLKSYYALDHGAKISPPTIGYCADKLAVSQNYLSDLLKKETGRTAKDHINDFIIDTAKNKLLSTNDSISTIAYNLGFNYPHYFSRLFKAKTGVSPKEYRG